MPSRRRSRSKNLSNNLADVQRRLRFLERRPVRTKLANRVVTRAAIAPNSVSADEAEFGTSVVVPPGEDIEDVKSTIENPKEGFLVVDASTGESQIYSETQETYYDVSDPVAQISADAASDAAGLAAAAAALAAANAQAAQTTADGKNKVYRQTSQPTTGPFAEGDLWFDTDDDNRIYRYTSGSWGTAVQLGNNAIASISANKLTAGTIDANVITVSNINAGNITAGNIASERLSTTQLNATNITAGSLSASRIGAGTITASVSISGPTITLTGGQTGIFRTDVPNNRRIEITDTDDIIFYGDSGVRSGTITSVGGTSWSGAPSDGDPGYTVPGGVMIYGGAAAVTNGSETYPSIIATLNQVGLFGGSSSRFVAASDSLGMYGPVANINNDITTIFTGYSNTGGNPWHLRLKGRLVFEQDNQGPLSAGSGQPSENGVIVGQVVFRYT